MNTSESLKQQLSIADKRARKLDKVQDSLLKRMQIGKSSRLSLLYNVLETIIHIHYFFSKVGLSRSTTGCVSACLFREFQLSASYEGLIETVPGINLEVLRMDKYEIEKEKDALFRGEFEVVKELVAALTDGDVRIKSLN